jgi:hypothetical protein
VGGEFRKWTLEDGFGPLIPESQTYADAWWRGQPPGAKLDWSTAEIELGGPITVRPSHDGCRVAGLAPAGEELDLLT